MPGRRINPCESGLTPSGFNPFGHDLHRWDDHHIDHGHHHDAGSIGSGYDHWSNTGASGFDPSRGY
jgi:hypothetical protein